MSDPDPTISGKSPSPIDDHNRRAWDRRADNQKRFAKPAKEAEFHDPLGTLDGCGWLGPIAGKKLLCLAAGGGRQGPLYAATGANVTVVDVSPRMLELDREVAAERGLTLKTVETSMDDLSMFATGEFDVVIHPVSTCYVPDVQRVFSEVARITSAGGLYISQHKQPTSLQASAEPIGGNYQIVEPYYRQGPLPAVEGTLIREDGTLEFLHRWEALIGSMCRAGFVIEDLTEPVHAKDDAALGSFAHRSQFVAPYVRIKARRIGAVTESKKTSSVLLP